jgi:hypothetical protein
MNFVSPFGAGWVPQRGVRWPTNGDTKTPLQLQQVIFPRPVLALVERIILGPLVEPRRQHTLLSSERNACLAKL